MLNLIFIILLSSFIYFLLIKETNITVLHQRILYFTLFFFSFFFAVSFAEYQQLGVYFEQYKITFVINETKYALIYTPLFFIILLISGFLSWLLYYLIFKYFYTQIKTFLYKYSLYIFLCFLIILSYFGGILFAEFLEFNYTDEYLSFVWNEVKYIVRWYDAFYYFKFLIPVVFFFIFYQKYFIFWINKIYWLYIHFFIKK